MQLQDNAPLIPIMRYMTLLYAFFKIRQQKSIDNDILLYHGKTIAS